MIAGLSGQIALWLAGLGLLVWAFGLWSYRPKWARRGNLLAAAAILYALWQAVNGFGSLGLMLLLGLLAALLFWVLGRLLQVKQIRRSARAWMLPLLLVFIVRNFAWEPYRIPSGSMLPTLVPGDYVLINRHAYGLNIQPMGWSLADFATPQYGDIAVFRHPDSNEILIKRIIGLPGDLVLLNRGVVFVNGERRRRTAQGLEDNRWRIYRESVGERAYLTRQKRARSSRSANRNGSWQLGEDAYFVLGDNRDNSLDSRVWGTVPTSHLIGRAEFIWLHWAEGEWPSWRRRRSLNP